MQYTYRTVVAIHLMTIHLQYRHRCDWFQYSHPCLAWNRFVNPSPIVSTQCRRNRWYFRMAVAATIARSLSLSLCHAFAQSIAPGGDYCLLDNSFWLLNYIFHLSLIFFSLFQFTRCVFFSSVCRFFLCINFFRSIDFAYFVYFFFVFVVPIQYFFFLLILLLLSHHKWACQWELSSLYAWIEIERETFNFMCRAARVLSHPMWLVSCLLHWHSHNTLLIMKEGKARCV